MERRRTVRTPNRLVSARAVPARWRHPPRRRRSWRARRAGEKAVYGVSCAVVRRTHHQDQPVSGGGVSLPLPPYDWPRLRRPRASARRAKRMQNLHARPLDESPPRVVLGYRRPGTSDAAAPQNARTHRPCQRNTSPVSYTHLDVYKRQKSSSRPTAPCLRDGPPFLSIRNLRSWPCTPTSESKTVDALDS